jgi:hypothetical protein
MMANSNTTPSLVRTGTPMVAGSILVGIARALGLDLTVDQAMAVLPVVMFLYYAAGRALETWNPSLGYVLGMAKAPAYSSEPSPSPGTDEHLETVVVPDAPAPDPEPDPQLEPDSEPPVDMEDPVLGNVEPLVSVPAKKAAKKAPAKRAPAKRTGNAE